VELSANATMGVFRRSLADLNLHRRGAIILEKTSQSVKRGKNATSRLWYVIATATLLTLSLTVGSSLLATNQGKHLESASSLSTSSSHQRGGTAESAEKLTVETRNQASTLKTSTNASLALDGKSTYVTVPNSPDLNITGPLTVDAWIKTNAKTRQGIVEHYGRDGGFALQLTAHGKLEFFTISDNKQKAHVGGLSTVSTDEWHHVAGVFDGSELRVFLDGVLDGRNSSGAAPASTTADLKIGTSGDSGGRLFSGLIDDVRVTAGIRYAANFTPEPRLTTGGLVLGSDGSGVRGLWSFDDQTTSDSSGYENSATLSGEASFPTVIPGERATVQPPFEPQSSGSTAVSINFDELAAGTNVGTYYRDRNKNIIFSSDAIQGYEIKTYHDTQHDFPSSPPNSIAPFNFFGVNALRWLQVDFPRPVNDLRFYVCDFEAHLNVASMDVYQNNVRTRIAMPVNGTGLNLQPSLQDFRPLGLNNITRVVIYDIRDPAGLTYDNFDFTFVPATPTPTPTPIPTPTPTPPPPAPVLLSATAGDEEISLQWTPSQGATTYKVKQLTASGIPINGGTVTGITQTSHTVRNLTPNVTAYFAVSAVNGNGESANSNTLSAIPKHNCGTETFKPRPGPATWNGAGWHFESEVSERDGLVIRNVSLNGRPMAVMMSLPYFEVKTSEMSTFRRGELTPDNADTSVPLRTRLIGYSPIRVESQPGHITTLGVKAQYAVDNLAPGSKSCLIINQEYEFHEQSAPGQGCEPSDTLPCSRFYPKTSYTFVGRNNEALQWINLPQRLHFKVFDNKGQGASGNSVGVFRDCEVLVRDLLGRLDTDCIFRGRPSPFSNKDNPIHWEQSAEILREGRPMSVLYNSFDSFHQTADPVEIEEPVFNLGLAGCPDCVHIHWRWGTAAAKIGEFLGRGKFGQGAPIGLIPGSRQNARIVFVKYRDSEIHPDSWQSIQGNVESIRDWHDPEDVVFWYVGTGNSQNHDEFFNHGAFFNPHLGANVQRGPSPNLVGGESQTTSADGPTSVTFGYLYQEGTITFAQVDSATLPPLPVGYVPLNNVGHNITTDVTFSGENVVSFSAPSVTSQTTFENLGILHAERDPFDPEGTVWVDRTILSPDPLAPNFAAHTINSRVTHLGKFVIAVRTQPPTTETADLSVSLTHSPQPVFGDNDLTYSILVNNGGPQQAREVGLMSGLAQDVAFVSALSSQGSCKFKEGAVYCKLGTLVNGANATVTVTVRPIEDGTQFPFAGLTIKTIAMVRGNESDPNKANNSATDSATAMPSSNARPSVNITSPTVGTVFLGPASISIMAQATDSDGSVAVVEFYDGQDFLGSGSQTSTANQFRFDWANVGFGPHDLRAVVTDNGGKKGVSSPVTFLVNGSATINITSPATGSVFTPGSSVAVQITASHPSGSLAKVELATDGAVVVEALFSGGNQYNITWSNIPRGNYVLSAVAIDSAGVETISSPVNVTITNPTTAEITTPVEGASYPQARM
jgi:hypothetical protein